MIGWDDLPGERPAGDKQSTPESGTAPPGFSEGCLFHGLINDVGVAWGPAGQVTVAPEGAAGEVVTRIAGQAALMVRSVSEGRPKACVVKVDLGYQRGVAAVVAVARLPKQPPDKHHPCAVATRLAAEIVKRSS